jgi:hypothetical protein
VKEKSIKTRLIEEGYVALPVQEYTLQDCSEELI